MKAKIYTISLALILLVTGCGKIEVPTTPENPGEIETPENPEQPE